MRARLGVGGYAAWVVVSHAGDKPGPDPRQRVLFQAAPKNAKGVHALRSIDAILKELQALTWLIEDKNRRLTYRSTATRVGFCA